MRFRNGVFHLSFAAALATLLAVAGCGADSSPVVPQSAMHAYNGTASVGDFLTISLNSTAHTLTYSNHSNGDAGTIPYTVNSDGTFTLSDPTGNFVAAYEVPNYALLIQAAKTGPAHNTPALITAVQSMPVSMPALENHNYNYMQFRTAGRRH